MSTPRTARASASIRAPTISAYAIYTSGSTGRPKGVLVPHGPLSAFIQAAQRRAELGPGDVTLGVASPGFDVIHMDMHLPLAAGACMELVSTDLAIDGPALARRIDEAGATAVMATPATFRALVDAGFRGRPGIAFYCGGEALPRDLARDLAARGALWNVYGPTETTVWSSFLRLDAIGDTVPIGRPLDGERFYVLDAKLAPVPVGVVGELCIGGAGVARGYHKRPDLTAERFVRDPFAPTPSGRMYRTGDLARLRPDGLIDLLGRADHQVKIRGHRIELGEIEAVLAEHPRVRQAIVIAHEPTPGDKRLAAYVVTSGDTPALAEIQAFLRDRLPDHMVPAALVTLPRFPLNQNGKIDRAALPPPTSPSATRIQGAGVPPRDDVEARLAAAWRRVLALPAVGVTDNFFDVGGHSILAVRLLDEIGKSFGKTLPLATIFTAQTIRELAAVITDGQPRAQRWPLLARIKEGPRPTPLFLVATPNANVLGYAALVRHLDVDRDVYVLQRRAPEESELGRPYLDSEIEGWASAYLEAVRVVCPEGPYLLGGMCTGTIIAFAMARMIEAEGGRVGMFGVFDTWPDENTRRPLLNRVFLAQQSVEALAKLPPQKLAGEIFGKLGRVARRLTAGRAPGEEMSTKRWDNRNFPGAAFVPPQLRCRITVFRTQRQPYWRIDDDALGWRARTTNGVDIRTIAGVHPHFMREPEVAVFGRELSAHVRSLGID
ncbi:MAG: amino acid adenylation domain-containing protein [Minicystis sp.]